MTAPLLMQGQGGQLYHFFGGKTLELHSMTFLANSNAGVTVTVGKANANRTGSSPATAVETMWFRGMNTIFPASYANHKPMAFYNDSLYHTSYAGTSDGNGTFIARFDGSGIFTNGGVTKWDDNPAYNGRGNELLTASGTGVSSAPNSGDVVTSDLCHLVYNGVLWIAGQLVQYPGAGDHTYAEKGWDRKDVASAGANNILQRDFSVLAIKKDINGNETRQTGLVYDLGGLATIRHHNHACDLIGFKNDLYLSTWIDVVRFQQCSGDANLVRSDLGQASAKSFALHPASGFSVLKAPRGDTKLLMLTGSGLLYRVNASGTNTLVNLASINSDVRPGDNWFSRINSTTAEPGRAPLLETFNGKLNAFITSATSGYRHFSCLGNPSGTGNWTDKTVGMPEDLRKYDGNLYGYCDEGFIYLAHVTMGNVGIWGHQGINTSAGAIYLYRYGRDERWTELHKTIFDLPARGLIPYTNLGPHLLAPSGSNPTFMKANDYTIIDYKLFDLYRRSVNVNIEFSKDEGLTWQEARRFKSYDTGALLGSGIAGLPTSPEGIQYDFYWDHVNDLGFNSEERVVFRLRPNLVR